MIKYFCAPALAAFLLASCGNESVRTPTLSIMGSVHTVTPDTVDCAALKIRLTELDSAKKELDQSFDAALIRLDSLVMYNEQLETKLRERNVQIEKLKQQVNVLLAKKKQ